MARGLFAGPARQEVSSRFVPIPFEDLAASATIKQARYDESAMAMAGIQEDISAHVPTNQADMMGKALRMQHLNEELEKFSGQDIGTSQARRDIQKLRSGITSDPFWSNMEVNRERQAQYHKVLNEAASKYPTDPWLYENALREYQMYEMFGSEPVPELGWSGMLSDSPSYMESVDTFDFLSNILTKLRPDEFVRDDATGLITSRRETGGVDIGRIFTALGIRLDPETGSILLDHMPSSVRHSDFGREIMSQAEYLAREDGTIDAEQLAAAIYVDKVRGYAEAYGFTVDKFAQGLQAQLLSKSLQEEEKGYVDYRDWGMFEFTPDFKAEMRDDLDLGSASAFTNWLTSIFVRGPGAETTMPDLMSKFGYEEGRLMSGRLFRRDITDKHPIIGGLTGGALEDFGRLAFDMEMAFHPDRPDMSQDRLDAVNNILIELKQDGVDWETLSPRDKQKAFSKHVHDFLNNYVKISVFNSTSHEELKNHREHNAYKFFGSEAKEGTMKMNRDSHGVLSSSVELYDAKSMQVTNLDEVLGRKDVDVTYVGKASPNNPIAPGLHAIKIGGDEYLMAGDGLDEATDRLAHSLTEYDRSPTGMGRPFQDSGHTITPFIRLNEDGSATLELRTDGAEGRRVFSGNAQQVTIFDLYDQFIASLR